MRRPPVRIVEYTTIISQTTFLGMLSQGYVGGGRVSTRTIPELIGQGETATFTIGLLLLPATHRFVQPGKASVDAYVPVNVVLLPPAGR